LAFLPEKGTQMNATATAAPRQRKPWAKPAWFVRLCIKPEGTAPGVLRLTVGGKAQDYFLTAMATDFGRGFAVEKVGLYATEGQYAVNIDEDKRACDCKGHARHGHCRHADGLAALIAAGRLYQRGQGGGGSLNPAAMRGGKRDVAENERQEVGPAALAGAPARGLRLIGAKAMLRIIGNPHPCLRRGKVVTVHHATPRRNLGSILTDGLLTAKSRGALKAVWLCESGRKHWACMHAVRRHGGRIEDVVVLEVSIPRDWLKRHGGHVKGLWRSVRDIPARFVRRIVGFSELSRSPVGGAA
jgi:hypothetical protein